MRKYTGLIAIAIALVFLSSCSLDLDNPFSDDGNDGLKLPKGCNGYVDPTTGQERIDQIPGGPNCTMLTATTDTPANTTVIPADQPTTDVSPTDDGTATDTPTVIPPATPTDSDWVPYESEGGVPYNGKEINFDVAPDEIEIYTAGPVTALGIHLPGGTNRGSIVIMLNSSTTVVHYTLSDVIPGSGWHASYRPLGSVSDEATWRELADLTIKNMSIAPNCTPGIGCLVIDVLVIDHNGVVAQWTW